MIDSVVDPQVRGKKWELQIMKYLKSWGYKKLARTILVNKDADNKGTDYQIKTDGKIPLNIQAKSSSKRQKYDILLHNIPNDGAINVVFHEHWWKGSVSGEYALLTIKDFERLINQ